MDRILVVEDSADILASIRENLRAEGYEVRQAETGSAGLELALSGGFELVVLDVMLPDVDGFAICRRLREQGDQTPVLFLTARGDPRDRIRGLREGGDDYMAKPFQLAEFLARVKAILRRQRWYTGGEHHSVDFGGNHVELKRYRAANYRSEPVELTHREAQVLKCLVESEGRTVSRDQILEKVWGTDAYPSSRTIDNFVLRLRRHFERDPRQPRHFHTVHGVGYRFTSSARPDDNGF